MPAQRIPYLHPLPADELGKGFQAAEAQQQMDQEVRGTFESQFKGHPQVEARRFIRDFIPLAQEEDDPRQGRVRQVRQKRFFDQRRLYPQGPLAVRGKRPASQTRG